MSSASDAQEVFSPDRTHLLAAGLVAGMMLLVIGAAPAKLFWILIFPVIFVLWVLRTKTVVDAKGIRTQHLLGKREEVTWEEITGIGFQGSRAIAKLQDGREIHLPAVTFNSLPRLEQASVGRIPDALTQGRKATDEKVRIVHKDGSEALITKEEYAEWVAKKEQEHAQQQSVSRQQNNRPANPTDQAER